MRARLGLVVVLAGSLVSSGNLMAQSAHPWSLQGSVLAAGQDINGGLVTGVGFEGQIRYSRGVWSLGAGYQTSNHEAEDESIKISGFFLEPRYAIDIGSERVAPYLAGRIAFLTQTSKLHDPDNPGSQLFNTESNGSAFGAGGGLIIRAGSKVNIDLGAAFVSQSFAEVRGEGRVFQFSRFTGYVAKAGLSFGFGGQ